MPDSFRQPLAIVTFFGAGLLMWFWLGPPGLFGFGFGISVMWLVIGITSGYWIGTHGPSEQMVAELMRRIRERRAQDAKDGH